MPATPMHVSPLTSTLASLLLACAELLGGELERVGEELCAWDRSLNKDALRLTHTAQSPAQRLAGMNAALDTLAGLLTPKERRRVLTSMQRVMGPDLPEEVQRQLMRAAARLGLGGAPAPATLTQALDERTEIVAPVFEAQQSRAGLIEHTQRVPPVFIEPATPSSAAPSPVLGEHFERCLAAFTELRARAVPLGEPSAPLLAAWNGALAVLRREARAPREALLFAQLDDSEAGAIRRSCAALVALLLEPKRARASLMTRAARGAEDLELLESVVRALELWRGSPAEQALLQGLDGAGEATRPRWLRALARRGVDPGRERVDALLRGAWSDTALAAGLPLVCVHAGRQNYRRTLTALLFTQDLEVRAAALVVGVALDTPGARIMCERFARDPDFFEACLVHALHASDEELEALAEWSRKPDAPAHAAFVVAYCARRSGIEAALTRHALDASPQALEGFRLATGFEGPAEELATWWADNEAKFDGGIRYLYGREASPSAFIESLRRARPLAWRAHAIECLIRSGGAHNLPLVGLPDALDAAVAELDAGTITWLPR